MSKLVDGMLGFALGDSIGVPIEFENRDTLISNPTTSMKGYGSYDVPAGTWSDDTSMSLATMDSITKCNNVNYNDIAERFCNWLNNAEYTATDEVFDIGTTTKFALIRYWDDKSDATKCGGISLNENGNGSLMRMFPIAYYYYKKKMKDEEIINIVNNVSSITHAHEISCMACYIYVRFIDFLLNGKDILASYNMLRVIDYSMYKDETIKYFDRILKDNLADLKLNEIKSSGYVVDSLEASIWVALNTKSFSQAIIGAINLGGDTDTIGAITGSIAGIIYGQKSFPKRWCDTLLKKESLIEYCTCYEKIFE